jgi:hypothetical protein
MTKQLLLNAACVLDSTRLDFKAVHYATSSITVAVE